MLSKLKSKTTDVSVGVEEKGRDGEGRAGKGVRSARQSESSDDD